MWELVAVVVALLSGMCLMAWVLARAWTQAMVEVSRGMATAVAHVLGRELDSSTPPTLDLPSESDGWEDVDPEMPPWAKWGNPTDLVTDPESGAVVDRSTGRVIG